MLGITDYSYIFNLLIALRYSLFNPRAAGGFFLPPLYVYRDISVTRWANRLKLCRPTFKETLTPYTYLQNLTIVASEMTSQWRHKVKPWAEIPYFRCFLRQANGPGQGNGKLKTSYNLQPWDPTNYDDTECCSSTSCMQAYDVLDKTVMDVSFHL